ncbi:type II toxin-antitoxin system VapC family toxin [Picosynechococcus sp. PCC 8807]|uniref:type II toxin-antitoxin system VapC family toxin n=1 Tax=Picosynechococcus sp. PCC 8807 TaxID=195248 RepID=UPI000810A0B9|nr:PIN domain-containing protein [Picosynechococcus sp. PCC 8807]ANV90510.1 PIN domain-containing protein [Picosynechococcus sp. PCC 8807]
MIIADTGFFLALFNLNDKYHLKARNTLYSLSESLITTHPVITETCYLLVTRGGGTKQECQFLKDVADEAFKIFEFSSKHFHRTALLISQYQNLPMDYADASLVVLAEELKEGRILTTDFRDFSVYRWNSINTFENLLLI